MADAVSQGAKKEGVNVVLKRIDMARPDELISYDGMIIGSPTYFGQMSGKVKTFLDESVKLYGRLEGKVGSAFTSSGGTATGAETTIMSILEAFLIHGMIIQGNIQGHHYGAAAVGEPDEEDLDSCYELGMRTARLVKRLFT